MRALIVEDDKDLLNTLEIILKQDGFAVDTTTVDEGLEMIKIYDYDIVLLDLKLPDISGYDVLKRIRNTGLKTPVLIISGLNENEHVEGLGIGADDYITKPLTKMRC